ncbi:MAG TPA: DUF3500 domain-containing protein [Pirellulales bacterium]|jgi:hypothetical protein|nr:DUF3500 domain-containing protein [Pirellulales bacterium]
MFRSLARFRKYALVTVLAASLLVVGSGAALLLRPSPVGTEMVVSASKFLASLTPEQKTKTNLSFAGKERLDWHFIPKDKRKGLQIRDMTPEQRKLAHAFLQTGLSQLGYDKATTIMSLDVILKELEKGKTGTPIRDPERYYFTIFGAPAQQGEWGWSVEGHHLSFNFVVRDGVLAATTPTFFGANPAEVRVDVAGGPKLGTRVLHAEEDLGFKLLAALTPEQRKTAIIAEKSLNEIRAAGEANPPNTPPDGLAAKDMTEAQVKILNDLIVAHADNVPSEEKEKRLTAIKTAGIEKVYFAWAGGNTPGIGHYYRVQGPTFVIEFCNTQPDVQGNPANHIHEVWRDMAGDFGLKRP